MVSKNVKAIIATVAICTVFLVAPSNNVQAKTGDIINKSNSSIYEVDKDVDIDALVEDILNLNENNKDGKLDEFLIETQDGQFYNPVVVQREKRKAVNELLTQKLGDITPEKLTEYFKNIDNLKDIRNTKEQAKEKTINDIKGIQDTTTFNRPNSTAIKLAEATKAVGQAETSKLAADKEAAQLLVTALPDGEAKTALQGKLDKIVIVEDEAAVKLSEATKAVEKAETSKLAADKQAAQLLVTALPDGEAKTALQGKLDKIITVEAEAAAKLETATKAVGQAETSKLAADKEAAQLLVTALPDGEAKTALQGKLDKIITVEAEAAAKLAEATTAVEKAETSKLVADKEAAQLLVTALPDGEAKTALQGKLDKIVTA